MYFLLCKKKSKGQLPELLPRYSKLGLRFACHVWNAALTFAQFLFSTLKQLLSQMGLGLLKPAFS